MKDSLSSIRSRFQSAIAYLETLDPAEAGVRKLRVPPWQSHIFIFVLGFFLLISRRPDWLFNAQFWAEDGRTWYMDAHRLGWQAFTIPCAGSLVEFPRILAGAVQGLPLIIVPTIFNIFAAVCHLLPAIFLFTTRMRDALPRPWTRWVLALSTIAVPGSGEVLANLSNVHNCHLPLLAGMIVLMARPSRALGWRIFDGFVVVSSALSGPFGIALLPLACIRWAFYNRTRDKSKKDPADKGYLFFLCCLIAICAAIQAAVILHFATIIADQATRAGYPYADSMTRHRGTTGASIPLFIDIVGGKVIFASLIGDKRWYSIVSSGNPLLKAFLCSVLFGLLGVSVLVRSLRFGLGSSIRVPLFIVYTWCIFFASLAYPLKAKYPNWVLWLFANEAGNRYWFIPMIGFFAALITVAAGDRNLVFRRIACVLLALAPIGVVSEWRFSPWPDVGFDRAAIYYDTLKPGSAARIPALPDHDWSFPIVKH